jgi:hypothetical protein
MKAKLRKKLIMALFYEKNANFFTENWQKSQKIVIITSPQFLAGIFQNKSTFFIITEQVFRIDLQDDNHKIGNQQINKLTRCFGHKISQ